MNFDLKLRYGNRNVYADYADYMQICQDYVQNLGFVDLTSSLSDIFKMLYITFKI